MPEFSQKNNDLRGQLLKYAGFLLNRRAYFSAQIRKKLTEKASHLEESDHRELIDEIIIELEKAKYLNDDYLLAGYIRQKLSKLQGPKIIFFKLKELGLKPEQINRALKSDDLAESIEQAKQKLANKYAGLDSYQLKGKLYQRGF